MNIKKIFKKVFSPKLPRWSVEAKKYSILDKRLQGFSDEVSIKRLQEANERAIWDLEVEIEE